MRLRVNDDAELMRSSVAGVRAALVPVENLPALSSVLRRFHGVDNGGDIINRKLVDW